MFIFVQDLLSAFRILFAHMNEQNAQHSTPDIPQHIYSLKDTEILLLSEGKKAIKPEYTDKLIEPPVLREQRTLTAGALSMQAELSHHCLGHGNITPSRSSHSSAPALHPPQGRTEAAAALSAGSLLSPTAPAPPALLSLPQPWLWGSHTRTIRLSSAPQCRQG